MRATVFHANGDVCVEQVPDSTLHQPTDALVRITHACICGSDLWFYRGIEPWEQGWRCGHEWLGVVEAVGSEVRTVKKGDRVIAPFASSDGTCEFCRKGVYASCIHGGFWGGKDSDGGQAEATSCEGEEQGTSRRSDSSIPKAIDRCAAYGRVSSPRRRLEQWREHGLWWCEGHFLLPVRCLKFVEGILRCLDRKWRRSCHS